MAYEPPVYPSVIPSQTGAGPDLPDRTDHIDWLYAARYNELKKELCAIMIELGTLPKGAYADVKTRLDSAAGGLPAGTNKQTIRHDGANWIADSNISNDGSHVAIGKTATTKKLDVAGSFNSHKKANISERNYITGNAWILASPAEGRQWICLVWAPELGLFVAVADYSVGNHVMTSSDGITWTARVAAADNYWSSITWAPELGLLVAVSYTGSGNRVMTSPDGITWTIRTSTPNNNWISITWAPELGLLVAVATSGTGNRVMTSPDAITWTSRASAVDNNWVFVTWASELGLLVATAATGYGNRVMTSPDAITWTARASAADDNWRSVVWAAELGLLVAVASDGTTNRVMTSPNAITWTTRTAAAVNSWMSVVWAPELGLLVAVAQSGGGYRVMTSPDGITWTGRTSTTARAWRYLAWAPELGIFVAVDYTAAGNKVMTSVSTKLLPYSISSKCRAYYAADSYYTATTTFVKVHLDTVDYDLLNEFTVANYRFTAKTAGYYQVNGSVNINPVGDLQFAQCYIYKNGVAHTQGYREGGNYLKINIVNLSDILYLTIGDYVELYTYHHSLDTAEARVVSGITQTFMSIAKLA